MEWGVFEKGAGDGGSFGPALAPSAQNDKRGDENREGRER